MKRLALLATLAVLPACTTIHEDRRVLTNWNWDLITDTARSTPKGACDASDLDGIVNPLINWVLVEPIACVMLPGSWLIDTLILNPIDGWKKAELQVYERRFGTDDQRGVSESALRNAQVAPALTPWFVGDILALPEFLGHWIWNSTYWTDPVNKESWNKFWNEHNEKSTQ
jgi:hypothetical protein